MILLDTNALIWWAADDARLGAKARLRLSDANRQVFVSDLSLLECSIKMRRGRLHVDLDQLDIGMTEAGFQVLPFDTFAARSFVAQIPLPQADPFDAGIVAQAVARGLTLITSDRHILEATVPSLRVVDARS